MAAAVIVVAVGCASASSTPPTSTAAPAPIHESADHGLVGTPAGRFLTRSLYQLVLIDGGCGVRPTPPADTTTDDPELADALEAVLDSVGALAETCNDPATWSTRARQLIDDIDELDRVSGPNPRGRPHRYEEVPISDDPAQIAPYLTRSLERLHHTLSDRHPVSASNFWFSSQHLGLTAELRRASGPDDVAAIAVVGSSIGYRGIDADVLSARLAQPVLNASLVGASVRTVAEWLPELREWGVGRDRVIWAVNTHGLHICTAPGRLAARSSMRDKAFEPIRKATDSDQLTWLLGPPTQPVSPRSPIGADWLDRFAETDPALDDTDPEVLARHRAQLDRYQDPTICHEEIATLAAAVSDANAAGVDVTIAVMPVRREIVHAHPDGRAGHDRALAELRSAVGDNATVVDLRDVVNDDLMVDFLHLDRAGRVSLSAELASAMSN